MSRWLRLTAWSATGTPDIVLMEDAMDLAGMLESTGRAVPRDRWVDEAIEQAAAGRTDEAFEGMV